MRFVFVHQNCPGQYLHYIRELLRRNRHEVFFITGANANEIPGLRKLSYLPSMGSTPGIQINAVEFESAMIRAQAAYGMAVKLSDLGMRPDVVIGHNGWGEMLHIADVWPDVPRIGYFEFFYHTHGLDVDFDPEFPMATEARARIRVKNAVNLLGLEACTVGQTPTEFQRSTYPAWARDKIRLIPEGAPLDACHPDTKAVFRLPGMRRSWQSSGPRRLVTFVARNLEPYRGVHIMLRALPALLAARPDLDVVMVGGDGVSYGALPPGGGSWKDVFLAELGGRVDTDRVFFPGQIEYRDYVKLLQVSAAHVYLTYPFVASWSLREAMATGCAIVASDTAPVREFIIHGENGLLVPFLEPGALVGAILAVLGDPKLSNQLRNGALAYAKAKLDSAYHISAMDSLVREITGQEPI